MNQPIMIMSHVSLIDSLGLRALGFTANESHRSAFTLPTLSLSVFLSAALHRLSGAFSPSVLYQWCHYFLTGEREETQVIPNGCTSPPTNSGRAHILQPVRGWRGGGSCSCQPLLSLDYSATLQQGLAGKRPETRNCVKTQPRREVRDSEQENLFSFHFSRFLSTSGPPRASGRLLSVTVHPGEKSRWWLASQQRVCCVVWTA